MLKNAHYKTIVISDLHLGTENSKAAFLILLATSAPGILRPFLQATAEAMVLIFT